MVSFEFTANHVEVRILNSRDHPLEPQRTTYEACNEISLVAVGQTKERIGLLRSYLAKNVRSASVAVQKAAIEVF